LRLSTLDLFEKSLVLLAGPEGGAWYAAARRLAERRGIPLDAYRVGGRSEHEHAPEGDVDWADAYGTTAAGAVLVRPDGFVAWRSSGHATDAEAVLEGVLREVLCSA
jgi:putative polyketide hydroxylase